MQLIFLQFYFIFCNCLSTGLVKYIGYLKIILVFIAKICLAKLLQRKPSVINEKKVFSVL